LLQMTIVDPIGYLAATLVLATFCMRSMRTLRWVAIASNLAFIAYAFLAELGPVLVLHALLLPVNVVRLLQLRGDVEARGQLRAEPHVEA
jgi:CRP/FNR family cyclic AMP-dependent transcriptional regulator